MTRSTLLYNAGNGRSSLYTLRRRNRAKTIPPNDVDLRAAKRHYRNAVAAARDRDKAFVSQVLVNYGNSLSAFGRYAEAIENYQQALDVDPKNGMAAGNLGVELEYAARLTGRFRHEYIALAREFLIRALGPHMHLDYGIPHAVQGFRLVLERLDQFINFHTTPILPPQPVKVAARTESQRRYVRFCIQNGLFLNAWVGNHELSPGVTDNISFGPIRTPIADIVLVPELLHILNEVKEAYATARYVYYLSQAQSNLFDAVSKATIYFDIDSYEINGLYTGLCKTAYSRAFDVLDKTARLINSYFDIGKREDSFWRIFVERQSLGESHDLRYVARPAICGQAIIGLYALADLCIDYFESEHVDLKMIDARRNKITHAYLVVKLHSLQEERAKSDIVDLDELSEQTKGVLHLAKHAILYSISAIDLAERQKSEGNAEQASDRPVITKPGQAYL